MIRVLILTGHRRAIASACLPLLVRDPAIEVAGVVFSRNEPGNRWKRVRRALRKIGRIGPLGALIGYRMRTWYRSAEQPDLEALAAEYGVPFDETPRVAHDRTRELFRKAQADLGLSLGNGYIPASVFEIPRLGMINVHGEILPDYKGAASVIWPIHDGRSETGFAIHRIDRGIDTGDILYVERIPIRFQARLRDTVQAALRDIKERIPPALVKVVAAFDAHLAAAVPQQGGRTLTTPTFGQYLRMLREHRRLRALANGRGGAQRPGRARATGRSTG